MGYLIAGHFTRQRPDSARIRAALPASVGFTVYAHSEYPLYAIDTYRAAKPSRYPLSTATPATDIPLEASPELDALYEQLRAENAANGLKRSYISLSRAISQSLGAEVLSVFTDDDGNDFACLSRNGEVMSGVARCGPYVAKFGAAGATRTIGPEAPQLHELAAEMVAAFAGVPGSAIGFGTFDPPENLGFKVADVSPPER